MIIGVSRAGSKKTATLRDYLATPEHWRGELINGALVERELTGPP